MKESFEILEIEIKDNKLILSKDIISTLNINSKKKVKAVLTKDYLVIINESSF